MSKNENSLDGAINDPRMATGATDEHQVKFSQDQWASMRGDGQSVGGSAVGSAAKGIDRESSHLIVDALKHTGLGDLDRDLTEAEKQRVITSAVRGAESVKDLIDIKRLERALDAEQKGYIDCFPNFHDLGKDARDGKFKGIGGGAIGRIADVAGGIAGHEIPSDDGAIFLPRGDNGGKPIGIVPANNPWPHSENWGSK